MPLNPGGWLTTTATRKAIDRLRRETRGDLKRKQAELLRDDDPPEPLGAVDDGRLRLVSPAPTPHWRCRPAQR